MSAATHFRMFFSFAELPEVLETLRQLELRRIAACRRMLLRQAQVDHSLQTGRSLGFEGLLDPKHTQSAEAAEKDVAALANIPVSNFG